MIIPLAVMTVLEDLQKKFLFAFYEENVQWKINKFPKGVQSVIFWENDRRLENHWKSVDFRIWQNRVR